MMALNGNMLGRMNSANIIFCNPLMFSGCIPYNINTNNDIYTAFNTIDKYMLYIQDCLLNVLKENNKLSYSYEIIKEIINHINKYYNDINNSGSNSSSKKNNMSNNFNNMCWKVNDINDMNAPILAKINEDINKFLCSLSILSDKTEYKDIVINSFKNNNNENDYCLILNKLNEYISNLQNALLKCLQKKDSILGLSYLIKNIEDFSNEIQRIMPCNSEMQQFGMQMNNCGIQNGLNQCSLNQNPMSMGGMPMNQLSMTMGGMPMNQNPMSMGSMPNLSFRQNLMNQINVIKSTVLNFLKDLKELIPLNKNPYIEGTEYFEPIEAKKENDRIIDKISSKVYKYIEIDEKENKTNLETEGKFLYSIGGIARKSLDITNKLYSELFEKYKIYLKEPKKINRNQLDKKNLSCWAKKNISKVNDFIKDTAIKYKPQINKYNKHLVHKNDIEFLFEIFNDFLSLFLKCSLSIPLVEVKFLDDKNMIDKLINNQEMIDLIIKNRSYKVNFCFLPQLTSNEGLIPGAKFHVFTYNEPETYKLPDANYEIVKQNTELDYNFKY